MLFPTVGWDASDACGDDAESGEKAIRIRRRLQSTAMNRLTAGLPPSQHIFGFLEESDFGV